MQMHACGYLHDPINYEDDHPTKAGQKHPDLDANGLLGTLAAAPEEASIKHLVLSVLNQLGIGSCVANAGYQAIRMLNQDDLGARLWGYGLSRSYHGMFDFDSGTHIRSFFRAQNKYGFLKEKDYKYGYDTSKFAKAPPPLAFRKAFDQRDPDKPLKYRRIFETGSARLDMIRQAISSGFPVVFGTDVSKEFTQLRKGSHGLIGIPNGEIAGGHAMTIVGYDRDGFEIVNSWGTGWANNGYAHLANSYLSWDATRDLWVVEQAPAYSET